VLRPGAAHGWLPRQFGAGESAAHGWLPRQFGAGKVLRTASGPASLAGPIKKLSLPVLLAAAELAGVVP
jgi:hypothetical protein